MATKVAAMKVVLVPQLGAESLLWVHQVVKIIVDTNIFVFIILCLMRHILKLQFSKEKKRPVLSK